GARAVHRPRPGPGPAAAEGPHGVRRGAPSGGRDPQGGAPASRSPAGRGYTGVSPLTAQARRPRQRRATRGRAVGATPLRSPLGARLLDRHPLPVVVGGFHQPVAVVIRPDDAGVAVLVGRRPAGRIEVGFLGLVVAQVILRSLPVVAVGAGDLL